VVAPGPELAEGEGWVMEAKMKQVLCAVGMTVFLLSGNLWGQQWGDWGGAANNSTIGYRYRVLNNRKTCDLEFKDQNQRNGYTTFDAAVDYQTTTDTNSTAPNSGNPDNTPPSNNRAPNNTRVMKTDGEHIVTTTTHNGSAQIPNCFVVNEVRVSFIQRQ